MGKNVKGFPRRDLECPGGLGAVAVVVWCDPGGGASLPMRGPGPPTRHSWKGISALNGIVIAVCRSKTHTFSKSNQIEIRQLGDCAVVEVTGLRNPWVQLDRFQAGLMQATLEGGENGGLVGRAGIEV